MIEVLKTIFLFWFYPQQDTKEGRIECKKTIRMRAILIIVVAIIALIIIACCFGLSTNLNEVARETKLLEKNLLWIKNITLSGLLKIVFSISAILCLLLLFYAAGILRHWKIREEQEIVDINLIKDLFNERYELDNRKCLECDKYSDSEKLIKQGIKDNSYNDFINYFKKATRKNPEELDIIKRDFQQTSYAKLLCVLSNPQYYTPHSNEAQLESLSQYFISFFPFMNRRKKRIKRVFSIAAIGGKTDDYYKEKTLWLFQYFIINYITGVETCILIENRETDSPIDYVVGKFPGEPSRLYSLRKSYFSYEKRRDNENDYALSSSDQLLANILESDFYTRWLAPNPGGTKRNKLLAYKGNWVRIRKELGLEEVDVISVIKKVAKCIKSCPYDDFEQKHRDALFKELNDMIGDKSLGISSPEKKELMKELLNIEKSL